MVRVDMRRSLLNKDLQKQCEFIVEYKVEAGCFCFVSTCLSMIIIVAVVVVVLPQLNFLIANF